MKVQLVVILTALALYLIVGPLTTLSTPVNPLQSFAGNTLPKMQLAPPGSIYLPMLMAIPTATPTPFPGLPPGPTINIPYVDGEVDFADTVIFWFGKVTPTQNYVDVRMAYTQNDLFLYLAVIDRRLWYDETPSPDQLTDWDAVVLFLDLNSTPPNLPNGLSYQFVAQFTPFPEWQNRTNYQRAYTGNGSGWSPSSISFRTISGWRGDAWNNNGDDRGWAMTFRIPFSSLGLSAPPSQGTVWRMGLRLHDRDDAAGSPIPVTSWPVLLDGNSPLSYGFVRFGIPEYTPPPVSSPGYLTIREGLNGVVVPDAAVGGTTGNLCNADGDFWNNWGSANFASSADFNIQNQADIADWPCFAKYYVTFPLDQLPAGSVIVSAKLILHHWGNSGSLALAKPSMIHVSVVGEAWNESTLTWNNAPLALENISWTLVPVADCSSMGWPCFPREWDVSRAVAAARRASVPLRLALYSTDSDYHSGKFFTTSETGEWNQIGRPTLQITWGYP